MHYLLDTNIFIAALKAQPAVRLRLESLPASAVAVLSPIVLGELADRGEKSAQAERNRARLDEVVAGLAVSPLDAQRRVRTGRFAPCSSGKASRSAATICGSPRRR